MNNDEPVQTWKINIFLVLLGITTAVLVAEVSLRLFYTVEPFELGEIEEWNPLDDSGFTPKLNELRFREDPVDSEILDERYTRVLFLGDSFTFGQGVSY